MGPAQKTRSPYTCTYLVEGGHGRGAHHQGYADDRVAVEAIGIGHHHDASNGKDGSHDLHGGGKERCQAAGGTWRGQVAR
jgi:hypothetical protein